jgi:hypothetical protein
MGREKDRFEQLLKLLPEGWKDKARDLKAFPWASMSVLEGFLWGGGWRFSDCFENVA